MAASSYEAWAGRGLFRCHRESQPGGCVLRIGLGEGFEPGDRLRARHDLRLELEQAGRTGVTRLFRSGSSGG